MASKFTKEEFDLYMPAFKEFDANGDGQITAEEFEISVVKNGDKFDVSEVKALINLFDTDGDGKINYEEFLNMMTVRYENLLQMSSKKCHTPFFICHLKKINNIGCFRCQ